MDMRNTCLKGENANGTEHRNNMTGLFMTLPDRGGTAGFSNQAHKLAYTDGILLRRCLRFPKWVVNGVRRM